MYSDKNMLHASLQMADSWGDAPEEHACAGHGGKVTGRSSCGVCTGDAGVMGWVCGTGEL